MKAITGDLIQTHLLRWYIKVLVMDGALVEVKWILPIYLALLLPNRTQMNGSGHMEELSRWTIIIGRLEME
jgi:hypothetical protein